MPNLVDYWVLEGDLRYADDPSTDDSDPANMNIVAFHLAVRAWELDALKMKPRDRNDQANLNKVRQLLRDRIEAEYNNPAEQRGRGKFKAKVVPNSLTLTGPFRS